MLADSIDDATSISSIAIAEGRTTKVVQKFKVVRLAMDGSRRLAPYPHYFLMAVS